jgi:hypothetical protein
VGSSPHFAIGVVWGDLIYSSGSIFETGSVFLRS